MFLEHDEKNAQQLMKYYGIGRISLELLTMHPSGLTYDVLDEEIRALVGWLFWFTDFDRAPRETLEERQRVWHALAQDFVESFNRPSAHAPITSFQIPPLRTPPKPHPSYACPMSGLPFSRPTVFRGYYGRDVVLTHPLRTHAVYLCFAVRLELAEAETPISLPENVPATRAEADALDWLGPTRQDLEDRKRPTTRFVEWSPAKDGFRAERLEHDWVRLLTCFDPWSEPAMDPKPHAFTPGMLAGKWVGRCFAVDQDQYMELMHSQDLNSFSLRVRPFTLEFHMREHYHYNPDTAMGYDDMTIDNRGEGVFRAWLPEATSINILDREIQVHVPMEDPTIYHTYDPMSAAQRVLNNEFSDGDSEGFYGEGIHDILLTTDNEHGEAWDHRTYVGRVRDWDGLVVLVRIETEAEPSVLFHGYVYGKQNLVGRWRESFTPVDQPGWEGVWSMSKVE
ncbi:hypothetical protein K439DRAFT_801889 [Ramaria rubella]|nr:hypothetical protein K439DRAFT_846089 [Ramaria rubella]KAF8574925.1 hypothetical protein K439DRAFT_801889 [Ramaria rubella]